MSKEEGGRGEEKAPVGSKAAKWFDLHEASLQLPLCVSNLHTRLRASTPRLRATQARSAAEDVASSVVFVEAGSVETVGEGRGCARKEGKRWKGD